MKKSEKLFMLINEIDDRFIENAKGTEVKPVEMKPEPRSSLKWFIALAACVAVLAVGVFAIVNFKLKGGVDPIDGNSSEISDSSDDSSSDNSDISFDYDPEPYLDYYGLKLPREFTEEDRELQEILKGLKNGVDDLNKLFIKPENTDKPLEYLHCGSDRQDYYLFPEGRRTEPHGTFAVPQTRAEMEERLLEYFAEETVEKFMSEVHKGSAIETTEGTFINFEGKEKSFSRFIEVDGRMYRKPNDKIYTSFPTLIPKYYIVCEAAKVVSRTDDTIYFTCISSYSNNIDPLTQYAAYTDSFENMECSLKYERGGWKLNYYYGDYQYDIVYPGHEDDSDKVIDMSKEFEGSAEDKEVFDILKPLVINAEEIAGLFSDMHTYSEGVIARFDSGGESLVRTFFPISKGQRTEPNGLFEIPQSYDGMRELLFNCLTPQAAESYMEYVGKGRLTENSDGSYALKFDGGYEPTFPTFVEIDGRMYRNFSFSDRKHTIDPYTVKLTAKTDEIIEFTCERADSWGYESGATDGFLANDGSGWKMNYYNELGFQPIFTKEDLELQAILEDLSPGIDIAGWFGYGIYNPDHEYRFKFSESDGYGTEYYLMPTGTVSGGKIEYPQSCDELEALLLKYFTQRYADIYMAGVCKGTMTENPDGTYLVVIDDEKSYRQFIEIDGKMYVQDIARGGAGSPMLNTAHITEKTESYIKFSCVHDGMVGHYNEEGIIRFERGGWRMSYNFRGFDPDDEN